MLSVTSFSHHPLLFRKRTRGNFPTEQIFGVPCLPDKHGKVYVDACHHWICSMSGFCRVLTFIHRSHQRFVNFMCRGCRVSTSHWAGRVCQRQGPAAQFGQCSATSAEDTQLRQLQLPAASVPSLWQGMTARWRPCRLCPFESRLLNLHTIGGV